MGRSSKLTAQRQDQIVSLIQAGNYSSQAAQAAGISERTFFRWMQLGLEASEKCEAWEEAIEAWEELSDAERKIEEELRPREEDQPSESEILFFQFWQAVKKAEAEAEAAAVLHIKKAAQSSWQAAAWYLERKHKDRWSRQDRVTHEGGVSHSHTHELLPQTPEQIEEGQRRLAEARALQSGSQAPESTSGEGSLTPISSAGQEIIEAEVVEAEEEE
jgi:hypothetical protein